MQPLRILHVIPNLLVGGAQRLVVDICNELRARSGVEVRLVVFNSKNEFEYQSTNLEIEVCSVSINISVLKEDNVDTSSYEMMVDEFKPQVIHSHLYLAEIVVHNKPRKDIAYFSHGHDNMIQFENFGFSTLSSKKRLTDFIEKRRLLKKYTKNVTFIAISKDSFTFFKKTLPAKYQSNIIMLHNAIDIIRFKKKALVTPSRKLTLIMVGTLLDKKNQTFLIDIVHELKIQGVEVVANIVGDGKNKEVLKEKINKLGLTEEVKLVGSIERVEEFLWQADIYVHTAFYEPFGLVLLEAMAAEVPVVSLNGRGNADIINDGENGYLIDQQDALEFVEKILNIMSSKPLQNQLIRNGLNTVSQYDIVGYADKLLEIYCANLIVA